MSGHSFTEGMDHVPNEKPKLPTKEERRQMAIEHAQQLFPANGSDVNVQLDGMRRVAFLEGYDYRENNVPMADVVVHATGALSKLATLLEFIDTVEEMRFAQRSFFKSRSNGSPKDAEKWLKTSKVMEKKVDELLIKLKNKSTPASKDNQAKLF